MSAQEQGPNESGSAAFDGAASHGHEVFDAEPVQDLAEGEPRTPLWLPVVGIGLFVLFGLYLALGDDDDASSGAAAASASATAARAGASAPATRPAEPLGGAAQRKARDPRVPADVRRIREGLRKSRAGEPARGTAGREKPAPKPHVHKPGDVH